MRIPSQYLVSFLTFHDLAFPPLVVPLNHPSAQTFLMHILNSHFLTFTLSPLTFKIVLQIHKKDCVIPFSDAFVESGISLIFSTFLFFRVIMTETSSSSAPTVKKSVIFAYIVLFLITGTCSLIFGKILYLSLHLFHPPSYQTTAVGKPGTEPHHFEKPWFSNLIMFFGMSFLLMAFEVFPFLWSPIDRFPTASS